MFTGIIEEIGTIERIQSMGKGIRLSISAPKSSSELNVNESVSVNGVCQTVVSCAGNSFTVEAVEETLKKTTFSSFKLNDKVNLELPMRLNERLGGHLVLGHVDSTGQITNMEPIENSWIVTVKIPDKFVKSVVPVGSIAIDGVSLTIAELSGCSVKVSIIPHTWENTIFRYYKTGSDVNLEFDVIGKYIERLMNNGKEIKGEKTLLSEKHLRELGY